MKNGIKRTRTGYNHIDSVVESAIDNYFGSVLFRLRNILVGGKLVFGKGTLWNKGKNINTLLLFFYSTAPRTCCLGSPVAHYQRPCEARSSDSSRRELFRQLAGSSNTAHGRWFAPLSLPLGPPSPLAKKCLSLWAVLGPFGHHGLDVEGVISEAFVFVYICFQEVMSIYYYFCLESL